MVNEHQQIQPSDVVLHLNPMLDWQTFHKQHIQPYWVCEDRLTEAERMWNPYLNDRWRKR